MGGMVSGGLTEINVTEKSAVGGAGLLVVWPWNMLIAHAQFAEHMPYGWQTGKATGKDRTARSLRVLLERLAGGCAFWCRRDIIVSRLLVARHLFKLCENGSSPRYRKI